MLVLSLKHSYITFKRTWNMYFLKYLKVIKKANDPCKNFRKNFISFSNQHIFSFSFSYEIMTKVSFQIGFWSLAWRSVSLFGRKVGRFWLTSWNCFDFFLFLWKSTFKMTQIFVAIWHLVWKPILNILSAVN